MQIAVADLHVVRNGPITTLQHAMARSSPIYRAVSSPHDSAFDLPLLDDNHKHDHGLSTDAESWDASEPKQGVVKGRNGAQLYLCSKGAPRKPGAPVVIFEAGLGVSGAHWSAVQRCLGPDIRSYRYDRPGYGHSPATETPRSAEQMATELLDVLQTAEIKPPYILVAHSYGGVIGREFMAAAGSHAVSGMVLVDANQENTHTTVRIPYGAIKSLSGGRDYQSVIGVRRNNRFTPEELGMISLDESVATHAATQERERDLFFESSKALAAKHQLDVQPLGMRPVTVIRGNSERDFQRLVQYAHEQDHGSLDDFIQMNEFIDRFATSDKKLQMAQLRLSCNSRFVQAKNSGHAVLATEPELVADEIIDVFRAAN